VVTARATMALNCMPSVLRVYQRMLATNENP
jgi:hypothetical protein